MSATHLLTIGAVDQLQDIKETGRVRGHLERRIAFVGRSNVGKSSLLNAIVGSRVARVSSEPGKTQCLHFYLWESKVVVDLPGYGYARQSQADRERWSGFVTAYLKSDPGLAHLVCLIDSRHGPSDLDEKALGFVAGLKMPVTLVMTKSDQLKTQSERHRRKKEVTELLKSWGWGEVPVFWCSVRDDRSLNDLQRHLLLV